MLISIAVVPAQLVAVIAVEESGLIAIATGVIKEYGARAGAKVAVTNSKSTLREGGRWEEGREEGR